MRCAGQGTCMCPNPRCADAQWWVLFLNMWLRFTPRRTEQSWDYTDDANEN